jgi:hypothetical protein
MQLMDRQHNGKKKKKKKRKKKKEKTMKEGIKVQITIYKA